MKESLTQHNSVIRSVHSDQINTTQKPNKSYANGVENLSPTYSVAARMMELSRQQS